MAEIQIKNKKKKAVKNDPTTNNARIHFGNIFSALLFSAPFKAPKNIPHLHLRPRFMIICLLPILLPFQGTVVVANQPSRWLQPSEHCRPRHAAHQHRVDCSCSARAALHRLFSITVANNNNSEMQAAIRRTRTKKANRASQKRKSREFVTTNRKI